MRYCSSQERNTDSNDRRSQRDSTDTLFNREVNVGVEDLISCFVDGIHVDS